MIAGGVERASAVGAETAHLPVINRDVETSGEQSSLIIAINESLRVLDNDVQPFRYSDRFRKIDYLIAGSAGLIAILKYLNYI